MLRSTVYALLNHNEDPNPASSDLIPDRAWRSNQLIAKQLPKHWYEGKISSEETQRLLEILRTEPFETMGIVVKDSLTRGFHPQTVWDAVILFAGELIMWSSGIISVHANTTINALLYVYHQSQSDLTKRLLLLQAISFVPQFRDWLSDKRRDLNIETFEAVETTVEGGAIDVFSDLSENRTRAAQKCLFLMQQGVSADAIKSLGRRYTIYHNTGLHDYKFTEAAFENISYLSPIWRSRYIAASLFYLNGSQDKKNALVTRAMALMR